MIMISTVPVKEGDLPHQPLKPGRKSILRITYKKDKNKYRQTSK
jgi:hypothetical protein